MADPTSNEPGDANAATNPGGDGVVLSGDEVAQGRSGLQILIVLAVSIILAAIVLFAVFGMHANQHADKAAGGATTVAPNTTAADTFNAPPADAPKQNPPPQAVEASRGS